MKSSEIALVLSANPNAVFRLREGGSARIIQCHERQDRDRREVTYTVEKLHRSGIGSEVSHTIHRHYRELRPQSFVGVVEGYTLESLGEAQTEHYRQYHAEKVAERARRDALVSGIINATTLSVFDLMEVPDKVLQVLSDALTVKVGA